MPTHPGSLGPNLLPYIANLELEVDRLRRHKSLLLHEVRERLTEIERACTAPADPAPPCLVEIERAVGQMSALLSDLQEPAGYYPTHDQVIAIAMRPLVEQVFRWQQRLNRAADVSLRLELTVDHIEWFPARIRHILDNLLSNAMKYRDRCKVESWVHVRLRETPDGYELQIADNGLGLPPIQERLLDLAYRATARSGLGVGLAVVQMLIEQSGGALEITAGEGQGTTFLVRIPRYQMADYLA